jgi:mono/diheme cytochrome c family protein
MKLTKPASLLALLLLLTLLSGCSFSLAGDVTPPPDYRPPTQEVIFPAVAPDPTAGAAIYTEKCAPCHGTAGLGDGPRAKELPNPVAAIGDPQVSREATPASWYEIVRDGKLDRFMPPFSSLSDQQRWDVLSYVYTLSAPQDGFAASQKLYEQSCAGCHGPAGKGDGPQSAGLPNLPDFTNQEKMAGNSAADFFQTITTGQGKMPAFGDQISTEDRWGLAELVRSFSFASASQPVAQGPTPSSTTETPPGSSEVTPTGVPQAGATPTITSTVTISSQVGTIAGKVINGSGGQTPQGLEVTLHGFDSMQLVISGTTTLQPDGTFIFKNIAMPPGRSFLATTSYAKATYGSDVVNAQDGTKDLNLNINVFDGTTDASKIAVDRMHLFFDFSKPGVVQVIELYILSNQGDKTLVAEQEGGPVLEFNLPPEATNLQFQDGVLGQRYIKTPGGFADTIPLRPNSSQQQAQQVMVAFDMPYNRNLDLSQSVRLPVNAATALLPQDGVRMRSAMFQDSGTRDIQGTTYHIYNASDLAAGSEVKLTLSGNPSGGSFISATNRQSLVIGLGALGLVLIIAGLLLFRRSRLQAGERPETEPIPGEEETQDAEDLMDAIIALDDLYQEGQLPEDAYRQRRAELKERLKALEGSEG